MMIILQPYGACRVCSVEVQQSEDAPKRTVASCHTPIAPGMRIYTNSESVKKLRKNIVELVLSDHPPDCLTCEVNGNCELQDVAASVGVRQIRYAKGEITAIVKKIYLMHTCEWTCLNVLTAQGVLGRVMRFRVSLLSQ